MFDLNITVCIQEHESKSSVISYVCCNYWGFLIPNVALAKKSHDQSSEDDGSISSSPSTTTGSINDGGYSAGWRDGQSKALVDERSGIDNAECGTEHTNQYCTGYIAGYTAEHAPFNILHGNSGR